MSEWSNADHLADKAAELEGLAGELKREAQIKLIPCRGAYNTIAYRLRERAVELRKGQPHRPDIDQTDAAGLT